MDAFRTKPNKRRVWTVGPDILLAAGAILLAAGGAAILYRLQPGPPPDSRPQPVAADPRHFLPTIKNSIGMTFARVPPGAFPMGDPFAVNARPHVVRITRPFLIGVHEVTQAQYRQVTGHDPSKAASDSSPVESISWDEARAFCEKLSARPAEQDAGRKYRLPTEAEWEYCCRARTTGHFWFGDEFVPDMINSGASALMRPMPVGSFPPNTWGLYDMHGNVWEWCADWYGVTYYVEGPRDDPTGPDEGLTRVARGGAWNVRPEACRSAFRGEAFPPDYRGPDVGFRVVCEAK